MSSVLNLFQERYEATKSDDMDLVEYLEECRTNRMAYATAAERIVDAIGMPVAVDTSQDSRLSRLFGNRVIHRYAAFDKFYGMEDAIEGIVNYFRHSAQGLEESKQILYLLGPVGGGKSSLAEKIKELAEQSPIYTLGYRSKDGTLHVSPYTPPVLSLFNRPDLANEIEKQYSIDPRYLTGTIGPWEMKRIREFDGDISKFRVIKLYPSKQNQIAIANTEPGDENTQDVSTLVGKVDIRRLEEFSQNDPDAYLYSGGLNLTTQGLLDFREMFKATIKMLNPLLFAVQEHSYQGTENISSLPFHGIVLAHSNEAEWAKFRNNKDNEAFIDRIYTIKVPYCLRQDEEVAIYRKGIAASNLRDAPVAPGTYEMMAQFAIMTRLNVPAQGSIHAKMRVYNGENLKEIDPRAKTYREYRIDPENRTEGFTGISTRWAGKRLSQVFNYDSEEIGANPIHLMQAILNELEKMDLKEDVEKAWKELVMDHIRKNYLEFFDKEVRTAYMESYTDYGQNLFDKYVLYAEHWVEDREYFDASSRDSMTRDHLNKELEKIEKPAGIANPKDFRNEVVRYCLRYARENAGKNPDWRNYEKLRQVIEKKMFAQTSDLIPIISFAPKGSEEEKKKHGEFIERMIERGYTKRQVRVLIEWYMQVSKAT